jgi:hypothetical protein
MLKLTMLLTTLLTLTSYFIFAEAVETDRSTESIIGTLTVNNMTEGQLLWMKGKVGEGIYTGINKQGHQCSIKVPVVIGGFSDTLVDNQSSNGFEIVITNQALSEALLSGKPIKNTDWIFREKTPSDGYIVNGIAPTEQFILNSRSRWVSWFLDEKVTVTCL